MPSSTVRTNHVETPVMPVLTPRDRRRLAGVNKRRRQWIADDPSRETLIAAITERAGTDRFMRSMAEGITQWGSLFPNQEAAVRRSLAGEADRIARREERKTRDAGSVFVGEVGKRQEFTLTVDGVFRSVTDCGTLYAHSMRDGDGNVVTYRGGMLGMWFERDTGGYVVPLEVGSRIVLRGTVKRHQEYDGIKRTVLQRPTLVEAPAPRVSEVPCERLVEQTGDRVRFPTWGWQLRENLHVRRPDGSIVPWDLGHEGDALLLPTAVVERVQGMGPLDPSVEDELVGIVLD